MIEDLHTICLSGGGARGISYLGIIKYLDEGYYRYDNIKNVIGVSIGAIFSIFIAQKRSYNDIRELFRKYSLPNLSFGNIYNLITTNSSHSWKELKPLLKAVVGDTKLTFGDLWTMSNIELTIVASNINTHSSTFFNHKNNKNMPIYVALKASIAYPFLLPPVKCNGHTYVDGGLTYNIPSEYYFGRGICFVLEDEPDSNQPPVTNGIFSVIKNVFKTLIRSTELNITSKLMVKIKYTGVDTFQFNLRQNDIDKLMAVGYHAISTALYNGMYNEPE